MSVQNLLQENDYDLHAKSLLVDDLEIEQITIVNSIDDTKKVNISVNSSEALVIGDDGDGNIYCNSMQFSFPDSSILQYYQDPPAFNIVFTDSNSATYNATVHIVRIGNFCNMTVTPAGNEFIISTTITDMISNVFIPSFLRPISNTFFSIPAQVPGSGGKMLFGNISTSGSIQITATESNQDIPADPYVTASFNIQYRCEAIP